jgi:hypothetical protein
MLLDFAVVDRVSHAFGPAGRIFKLVQFHNRESVEQEGEPAEIENVGDSKVRVVESRVLVNTEG